MVGVGTWVLQDWDFVGRCDTGKGARGVFAVRAVDHKPGAKSGLEPRRWQGRMTLGSMRSVGLKSCGI